MFEEPVQDAQTEAKAVLSRSLELLRDLPGPTPTTVQEFAALLLLSSRWKIERIEAHRQRNQKLFIRCVILGIPLHCESEGRRMALMVATCRLLELAAPSLNGLFGGDAVEAERLLRVKWAHFEGQQQALSDQTDRVESQLEKVLPKGLSLYRHQLEAVRWVRSVSWRGIIADDRGLGKTIEALTVLLHARQLEQPIFPVLVVAPLSMQETWAREARKWLGTTRCRVVLGSKEVSVGGEEYEALRQAHGRRGDRALLDADPVLVRALKSGVDEETWTARPLVFIVTPARFQIQAERLVNHNWGSIIWDEFDQYLIRHDSATASTFLAAVTRARPTVRLALSGTSVPNGRPMGLYTILRLLGALPAAYSRRTVYGRAFCLGKLKPMGRKRNGAVNWKRAFDGRTDPIGFVEKVFAKAQLRRTKAEAKIQGMPAKVRTRLDVACTWRDRMELAEAEDEAKRITHRLAEELRCDLTDEGIAEDQIELQVRRALLTQASRTHARSRKVLGRIKARAAVDALKELWAQGERPLLFCDLVETADYAHEVFSKAAGSKSAEVWKGTGKTSTLSRQAMMDRWQAGEGKAWVLTRAFSSGITLTSSRVVGFVERYWDPKWELQAEDRVHRIGQTEDCSILVWHVPNSLDDAMDALADWKESGMEGLLGNPWHRKLLPL